MKHLVLVIGIGLTIASLLIPKSVTDEGHNAMLGFLLVAGILISIAGLSIISGDFGKGGID